MNYKNDWDITRQRIKAWWSCEILDRPAIQIVAPKSGYNLDLLSSKYDFNERCTNPKVIVDYWEDRIDSMHYIGEAFPSLWLFLGSNSIGSFLGCETKFDPTQEFNAWQEPSIREIKQFNDIEFDNQNKWYKLINEITDLAVSRAKGNYAITMWDIGSSADTLANMLGTTNFLYELVDSPTDIKVATKRFVALWKKLYMESFNKMQKNMIGSVGWLSAWSEGKTYPLQCDVSAMLSKDMFEEFFLPEIQEMCRFLDDPIYHLDGKEALTHLDLLLEIPELKAIQWCPGASVGEDKSMLRWIPILKKIQSKGKAIYIEVNKNEVEAVLSELSPYGLMIGTSCSSEDEANSLIRRISKKV